MLGFLAVLVGLIVLVFPESALAEVTAQGTLRIQGALDDSNSSTIDVGGTFRANINITCYDANGNMVQDSITMSISGAPSTGQATANFDPNPVQTFSSTKLTITTTKNTDAKVYHLSIGAQGPLYGVFPPELVDLTVNPIIGLSRRDLVTIVATGKPISGGSFSYDTATVSGASNVVAPLAQATGNTSTTNPNTTLLSDPDNPSKTGSPTPGALGKYTANYKVAGLIANNDTGNPFEVPVFGMSCYYTTLESDWGVPPDQCKSVRIKGAVYSGTVTNPNGLTGTFCSSFIAEVKLQGSAVLDDGTDVQYNSNTNVISPVAVINGHDGSPVVADSTVARSLSIIRSRGVHVDVHNVGAGLLANDTGNDIQGYRLDLYRGAGAAVCSNYSNVMGVSACTPEQSACPTSELK